MTRTWPTEKTGYDPTLKQSQPRSPDGYADPAAGDSPAVQIAPDPYSLIERQDPEPARTEELG